MTFLGVLGSLGTSYLGGMILSRSLKGGMESRRIAIKTAEVVACWFFGDPSHNYCSTVASSRLTSFNVTDQLATQALVVASSIKHFPNMLLQLLDQIQPCQEVTGRSDGRTVTGIGDSVLVFTRVCAFCLNV